MSNITDNLRCVYPSLITTRQLAMPVAQISSIQPVNTPVRVVVHTFWGNDSCFNNKINLECSLEDTGLSIKHKLSAKTGVPVSLQKLYVGQNVFARDSRAPLGDRENIAEYHSLLRLRHDTKDWQLDVLLELPVPLCHNMKADALHKEEYLWALGRYSSMLKKVKAARKDPKVIMDMDLSEEEMAKSAISDKDTNIAAPQNEEPKDLFVMPNNRLYLLYFYDMPVGTSTVSGSISNWFNRQFPIEWMTHVKFAFLCYVIRATCDNEPWVNDVLLYAPPALFLSQIKVGRIIWRSLFHMLPTQLVPKVISNVLPAQLAQQLN